jgi:hypothetical protein
MFEIRLPLKAAGTSSKHRLLPQESGEPGTPLLKLQLMEDATVKPHHEALPAA